MDGPSISRLLTTEGRSRSWLSARTGYSYSHVTKVLAGELHASPEFVSKVLEALGTRQKVADIRYGQVVRIDRSVFEGAVSPETIEWATEQAWKEAWVAEHGRDVLAAAADRAWRATLEINAVPTR